MSCSKMLKIKRHWQSDPNELLITVRFLKMFFGGCIKEDVKYLFKLSAFLNNIILACMFTLA